MRFVALVLLLTLALAAPAAAQTMTTGVIDEAAAALRSDNVYVDPDAEEALSDAEADALRERIRTSGAAPMYVAVLPEAARGEAGGSTGAALQQLAEGVGDAQGAYALVAGRSFAGGIVRSYPSTPNDNERH